MKELATKISNWMHDYAVNSNRKALVIGVSGGVDSALVSTLCAMTGLSTHCVILPCQSRGKATDMGKKHISWLKDNYNNIFSHYIDLTRTFDEFYSEVYDRYDDELAYANAKSRLRMVALYHVATVVGGLVVGTGNKVEDFGVGFFTKYGDGGVDISPIADLTKTEVREMSRVVGVSEKIVTVAPTDGLWMDDRTDEDQLGASYTELEWAMDFLAKNPTFPDYIHDPLTKRQGEVISIYNKWHNAGAHKLLPIPTFKRQ